LHSTDQEVSRVAFETGFGSISRFYEAFKIVSGRTPRQYRMLYEPPNQDQKPPFNPCARTEEGSYK
jgi:AraC family transcriptional regulator, melibiose operon regulatory protein